MTVRADDLTRGEAPRRERSRGERFTLTELGVACVRDYLEAVVASRATAGRASFEEACAAWAARHLLRPIHGQLLSELWGEPMTARILSQKVDGYGATMAEARTALDELVHAKLVSTT